MSNPINTIPIQQFIQQVKSAEQTNQKEVKLDLRSAKNLAYCLAEINAKLLENYDAMLAELRKSTNQEVEVRMDGGGFTNN
jgi:L-lactate utilization protein LutB